jgi:phage terminase Nu1 subunit (DNA packaging protein)
MASERVSLAEYGRRRGVSAEAVRRAIQSGRLREAVTRDAKGNPKIDPEIANGEWEANTSDNRGWHAQENAKKTADADMKVSGSLNQSRAIKEAYLARLAKLEFEERSGKLISADDVKHQAFKVARTVRDSILNLPDRVAAQLAAETDPGAVHLILTEELRKALEELQNVKTI